MTRSRGLTIIEVLTIVVALVVVTAVAIPLWHSRDLKSRRQEAMEALLLVQKTQDEHFGKHARYADLATLAAASPEGVAPSPRTARGLYEIEVQPAADGLGYVAIARALLDPGRKPDTRCAEFRINHQGRRTSINDQGTDTSRDCWTRR